ncbi:hypothetical protein [Desulfurococcus mucosus]|uniref:Uncharacterized protein n=1 Tax=Desulfurococcus mucosus (strain ATCC 35584 / DSM 2162 / JCM 9187 / O7/1) TaxID=765177 RepID=E8R9N6_DESM0|nr:hypothetical protein [Desulfurococcus mucosus]ADV65212.1 hypothetical protein Desmu_0909 [Desulfurococcus mucosus DSM 2162]
MSTEVKCPRDGNTMILVLESEKLSDGTVKAYFSYRCPICGFRLEAERIEVTRGEGVLSVKRTVTPQPPG